MATAWEAGSWTYPSSRSDTVAGSFIVARAARARSWPSDVDSSSTTQSGTLNRVASSGHATGASATRRSTALTSPRAGRGDTSTVSPTAAWRGTPANTSW